MIKKLFFGAFLAFAVGQGTAQTVIFQDDFEGYKDFEISNIGSWTLTDVDMFTTYGFNGITFPNTGVAKSYQVYNSTATTPPMTATAASDWSARSGVRAMVCFAADTSPWNNDWLISPQVQMTAGVGGVVSFWGKACDATYGAEKFKVLVSTTGTATTDFTAISPVVTTPADAMWHQYSFNLNAYAGQQIYIAIQCTSADQFGFAVDDFQVSTAPLPTAAPDCPTLTSPTNGATSVPYASLALSWTAATTGAAAASYDVYLDKNANPTTLVSNVTSTSYTATNLDSSATYYWKVIAKNEVGAATGCQVFSFQTAVNPVAPYCGPVNYDAGVEPITSVSFGGMTNTSPAATGGTNSHEVFLDKIASVSQGATLPIVLKGNTDGPFTDRFLVFIDWNQDGDFADAGETYFTTTPLTINGSTGVDTKSATGNILVPTGATLGNTRMRVKKTFSGTAYPDPCAAGGLNYGQSEDYTVFVGGLAVSDTSKNKMSVYPNPVKDVLNITKADSKITETSVYSMDGKLVKTVTGDQSAIKMNDLTPGAYLVKVKTATSEKSFKVIKK